MFLLKTKTGEALSGEENIHHNKQPDVLWSGHQKAVELSEQGFIQSIGNIHAYSPTNDASIESKDDFYEQLEGTVQKCNRNDILLITGDLNA